MEPKPRTPLSSVSANSASSVPAPTGFSHATLEELHTRLWPLRTDTSPFRERVKDEAVTTWVKPRLVAEVKFTEWTKAGEMRHPVYLGLREDKRPEDVIQEKETAR